MKRMIKTVKTYIRQTAGAIAILFALMAPLVIGSVGMALDMAQAYLVQQRLSQALDAAALAGAASSGDAAEIEARIKAFFDANYPPDRLGLTFTPVVTINGDEVHVSGQANYNTFFLKLLGIEVIDLTAETTVQRDVKGLEVALVLDNTGSMSSNDNITSLKRAATSFINIMFDGASNEEYVRIGIVPYSNSVNVGRYGLGLKPDGSDYDGDAFVNLPDDVSYTTNHNASSGWYGCVTEHMADNYSYSATYVNGSYGQLWMNGTSWDGHGWSPDGGNDPYPYDVFPDSSENEFEGPWDIYQYGTVGQRCVESHQECTRWRDGSCRRWETVCDAYDGYEFNVSNTPNNSCPYATIVPLTSDRDFLLDQVDPDDYNVMYPHGNTLGNIGMLWGGRLLSPEPPFTEGHDWDSDYWEKAIVMMTDGDNTENGTYSSFWVTNKNTMSVTKFNQRFEETCENLKDRGVLIYTITFTSGINDTTKQYYKDCATSLDQYYDAPDQADLEAAFENIARELSNLHIKG